MWEVYEKALANKKYIRSIKNLNSSNILNSSIHSDSFLRQINFSKNDYLALNLESNFLKNYASEILQENIALGSTGARLLSGQHFIFNELEKNIAQSTNKEAALLFTSGFAANLGALHALLSTENCYAVLDKRNHASVYAAINWARVPFMRYSHNNLDSLSKKLKLVRENNQKATIWVITETLFGMDGDIINLDKILDITQNYKANIYLDEAHSIGIYGKNGYGFASSCAADLPIISLGTFGKALGLSGAYISSPKIIYDYLINFCHSFIYSTMFSPFQAGLILKTWQNLPNFDDKRTHLKILQKYLQMIFDEFTNLKNYFSLHGDGHIQILKATNQNNSDLLLDFCHKFLESKNIILAYIKPPTVPFSCLKINLCADHKEQDLYSLLLYLDIAIDEFNKI